MIRLLTIAFFVFVMLFSIVWTAMSVFVMVRSRRSTSWPKAIGTVVSAEVRRVVSEAGASDGAVNSVTYEPYVKYAYAVAGRAYEHDKFASAAQWAMREPADAEAIVRGYPVGHQVPVFYNPSRPDDAVLVPGGSSGNWYFLLVGCVLFVASVIVILTQW
jgi:hypothetical protein